MRRLLTNAVLLGVLGTQYSVLAPARADWTRFRGPNGQGASADPLPTAWSETQNVAWKTAVPAEGWSSPVVAGGKVYLTGVTDGGKRCHVLAFDAASGKPLWNREVFGQEARRKETKNSHATPTPVVDADTVFAVFGGGGIAAVSTAGEVRWTYDKVSFYSQHGLGASPVVYRNLLVMPFDGSSPGPDKKVGWQTPWEESFILALDTKTGAEVWRARRGPSRIAHSTPVVLSKDGREVLVSNAGDVLQGFDPATGKRLWSVPSEGEGLVPSVVLGDGVLFATPGWPKPALRAWAVGDPAAAPKLLWEQPTNVPMLPTPVYAGGYLFTVSEKGFAACLDPKTGKPAWEERLPGSYSASLVTAAGKVYALSEQGEATVFEAKPEYVLVARNKLAGTFQSTPAAAGGRLYVRSATHLYGLGK